MAHETDDFHHQDTARLEAFSDGVFAIAITLLVIEIGVPHVDADQSLAHALRELWPSYAGYAVSFITIGIMWANHHGMFKDIERTDHSVLMLNLVLLMCIAFVPFPTALVADYLREGSHEREATLAYCITFTCTAVAFNALWLYAWKRPHLLDDHVSKARLRSRTLRYLPGPMLYGATIPLAFASHWAALALIGALALLYLLPLQE
jgi:uncharacterized membrane protein